MHRHLLPLSTKSFSLSWWCSLVCAPLGHHLPGHCRLPSSPSLCRGSFTASAVAYPSLRHCLCSCSHGSSESFGVASIRQTTVMPEISLQGNLHWSIFAYDCQQGTSLSASLLKGYTFFPLSLSSYLSCCSTSVPFFPLPTDLSVCVCMICSV